MAEVAPDRPLSKVHLPGLDVARGLAIVLVLLHNLSIFGEAETVAGKLWTQVIESGWVGVQLFFVLSGFLITGILVDDRGRPRYLRVFYARRFLRIFPLYYIFLVLYYFILPWFFVDLRARFSDAIWFWLYLSNWPGLVQHVQPGIGHFWSLAVEEQFYLVWPLVVMSTRSRTVGWVCTAIVVAAFLARVAMQAAGLDNTWLYMTTIARTDALVIGALVALAFRSPRWRARLDRALAPVAALCAVALAALVLVTHGLNRHNPLVATGGYAIVAVGSAVLVAWLGSPSRPAWSENRALRFLGKYSYAIYLLHLPLKTVALHYWREPLAALSAQHPLLTDWGFIACLGVASVALALLSWVALEQPFLRLKESLGAALSAIPRCAQLSSLCRPRTPQSLPRARQARDIPFGMRAAQGGGRRQFKTCPSELIERST